MPRSVSRPAIRMALLGLAAAMLAPARVLAQAASAPAEAPRAQSFLSWMGEASGPIGVVILLMSFYLTAVVAWMLFEYRRGVALPEALIRDLSDRLQAKQYTEAYPADHGPPVVPGPRAGGRVFASCPAASPRRRRRWSWPTTT